ncbi:UNVERIFIED_ORG: hypothetical protein J2W38_006070 [Variovorax paradoxus]|nr:hypothetical protein [Variovorax paradoxus]
MRAPRRLRLRRAAAGSRRRAHPLAGTACGHLAHPWRGRGLALPWTSLSRSDLPAAGEGARRTAVAVAVAVRRGPWQGPWSVLPRPSPCAVTVRARCRGTGFACKGVFITLRVTKASPLLSRPRTRRASPSEELRKTAVGSGCPANAIRHLFPSGSESWSPAGASSMSSLAGAKPAADGRLSGGPVANQVGRRAHRRGVIQGQGARLPRVGHGDAVSQV